MWKLGADNFAKQSVCGIPRNAIFISKVAIHPYFLNMLILAVGEDFTFKTNGNRLGRKQVDPLLGYSMQDTCIYFWNEDSTSNMILKVTDIYSIDPGDPARCATSAGIKSDRSEAITMEILGPKSSLVLFDKNPAKIR